MKKIMYKVLLGLCLVAVFTACSLDEYNPTSVPADDNRAEVDNWLG
ncbi:MAG: hypothetical protein LUD68_01575 [Rikenellaceae bacterium]|nr:hypothetical protein [Rikenellaceae bacterium]